MMANLWLKHIAAI